jgi:hypothetical protein
VPKYQTLPRLWSPSCVSIDPGAKACAVAISDGSCLLLQWVGMVCPQFTSGPADSDRLDAGRVIVELPEANGRATPPDDLIAITAAGFFLAGMIAGGPVRAVTPREWKGQTPKPAHHKRLWAALSAAERELLGGAPTLKAIEAACQRGAKDRWRKQGARYYRASEFPTVRAVKITHDILDASALNLYDSGRLPGP